MNLQSKSYPEIHTVRVFVDDENRFGSPLGIVIDEDRKIDKKKRQEIAADLNYSETVFIDDAAAGSINVFSPIRECPFSMYAALGASWFIKNQLDFQITHLVSKSQKIKTHYQDEKIWVRSESSILPSWNLVEYETAAEIESFKVDDFMQEKHVLVWAWIDRSGGVVRARTFANDWGIPEDEANGSGSMRLALGLQRDISILHGKGSLIFARPLDNAYVEVGGKCNLQAT